MDDVERIKIGDLEGRYIVLNYSYGSYWDEEESGADDQLAILVVKRGKLEEILHPHEEFSSSWNKYVCDELKSRGIREVYTPSIETCLSKREFFGIEWETGGDHGDEDDRLKYDGLCFDDDNSIYLERAGIKVKIFDLVD